MTKQSHVEATAENCMENALRVAKIVEEISREFRLIFADTASLIWFGSWVKGNAREQSDIDLAITGALALDNRKLLKFQHYLSDFPTLYKIDLVDMRYASDPLKNEINRHGRFL